MPLTNKNGLKQVIREGWDVFESPQHLKSFLRQAWDPLTTVAARLMHEVSDEPIVPINIIENETDGAQKIIDYFTHLRSRRDLTKGTDADIRLL